MNALMTQPAEVDVAVTELREGAQSLARCHISRRIELVQQCVQTVSHIAKRWCEVGCAAKKTSDTAAGRAEEMFGGPISTLRFLQLTLATLQDLRDRGKPRLPGKAYFAGGQLRVPVFPTRQLFDRLIFMGLRAECWLQPEVTMEGMFGSAAERLLRHVPVQTRLDLVLGAGNVAAIPITDALTKIFHEDRVVLLKMNPVNEYLGEIFSDAFKPLIQAGWLRIIYGATSIGAYSIHHPQVDAVHITGSADSHEAIVWGIDPSERLQRKRMKTPLTDKPISSELGNVTPWIIVPGDYSQSQLNSQIESIGASITNNASFNCIATKMIITCKQWPQRQEFLHRLQALLERIPARYAYYPGAAQRHQQFSGVTTQSADGRLPWVLKTDVHLDDQPEMFRRESFVCVLGETSIGAGSPTEFLQQAVEFVNEQMTGTLAAGLTVPNSFARNHRHDLDQALRRLKYGTIGVNQWNGLGFAFMSTPWGGFPGATLENIDSGIGTVHNTYLLEKPQKTVLYGKLKLFPRPVWFSEHACPDQVAQRLLELYANPSLTRLPALFAIALRG